MIIPLYIYEKNIQYHRFKITKNKLDNPREWKYLTFIYVFTEYIMDSQEYFVYYSHDDEKSFILEDRIENNSEWKYQFSFFTYPKKKSNTSPFHVNWTTNPDRDKYTLEYPREGWSHKFSFYVLKDIYYNPNISVIRNKKKIEKKISIVMAYFNRKEQILFTLKTIQLSTYKNFEVIIVDDNSREDQKLDDIIDQFDFDIILIRLTDKYKRDKGYKNPCIVYNIGFEKANGEIIVIQNPECCHIGDVLTYLNENLLEEQYFTFSCFAIHSKELTEKFRNHFWNIKSISNSFDFEKIDRSFIGEWYNHPIERPDNLHFLSAIYNSKLKLLGGFNEMFAFGCWYDDNEFIFRIKNILQVTTLPFVKDVPFAVHQWHPKFTEARLEFGRLKIKNRALYKELDIHCEK